MKQLIVCAFLLANVLPALRAQHIFDANFANAIRSQCPTCIDANDDLLAPAASLTRLDISYRNIASIFGITGFSSLDTLICSNNVITSLSSLPSGLTHLYCRENHISFIASLPSGLVHLDCHQNPLTSLPVLPNSLEYLDCGHNSLTSLPTLSTSLTTLLCEENQLTSLPALPSTLMHIECFYNQLTALPTLPNSLTILSCYHNQLNSLPTLPPNLSVLRCQQNNLSVLPALPSSLGSLTCAENHLTSLPTLPTNLWFLNCCLNQISVLPTLPSALTSLNCRNNNLSALPPLPTTLEYFGCDTNHITALPTLPDSLIHVYCASNLLTSIPSLPNTLLALYCGGNNLTNIPTLPSSLRYLKCENNIHLTCLPVLPNDLLIYVDSNTAITCLPNIPVGIATSTTLPICTPNNTTHCPIFTQLTGFVYIDYDNDCTYNNTIDTGKLSNTLVQATDLQGNVFSTYTNANGQYAFTLPVNQYTIQVIANPSYFYNPCTIAPVTVTSSSSLINLDLGMRPLIIAPLLAVNIDAISLRQCSTGRYAVHYQNTGTSNANNAYIDITFDNFLTYTSNSLNYPNTSLGNNTYRFQLGTVAIGQQTNFTIDVAVSCSAQLGQVHCTEAQIYPNLLTGLNWTGPIIEILDSCLATDSVLFRLSNTGATMLTPQFYQIVEDNAMFRPNTAFQLNAGQTLDITIPAASNKTYRIEVTQAPNYPAILGNPTAWAVVQNCNGLSTAIPNIINQFYTNNTALAISTDCSPNRNSYDPNVKSAQQIGYGTQHFINANTPLEYRIDFQNTGTDTAFRVVVLDTLDMNVLDITSIVMGTASHNFTWALLENHILQFTFDGINLVDSFTNEPASHGYVTFNIKQQPNLANGTVINNSAAIYFDFNAPIITNTCFHTIGEDFITILSNTVMVPNANINVYPNPFEHYTTFEISNVQYQQLTLKIRDVLGNEVTTLQSSNDKIQLERNHLASGVYFYQLYADDKLLNTGKIIAQ